MEKNRYDVYCISCGKEELIAENMLVEDACILVKALFEHYFAEPGIAMQIRHREKKE